VDHPLLLWSIRLALLAYFASLALRLSSRWPANSRLARGAWTAGCGLYVLHVLAAFHFAHGWSHAAAHAHTALQTRLLVGIAWGGGLWLNHLFTAVWLADVLWWWLAPQNYLARPRGITLAVQAWLAFIAFNATVIFGQGAVRWASAAAWAGLLVRAVGRPRRPH
jgi:hypothetical protein